jgi:hypothetical protein
MLKVLVIRCDKFDFSDRFWLMLAETHGQSLQRLIMRPRVEGLDEPSYRSMTGDSLAPFISLRTLDLALPTSDYISYIPFIASLETLRISVRTTRLNESSLHRHIADHAHRIIRKFWELYADQLNDSDTPPVPYNLEVFSIHFWRWETASAHAEQNGLPRVARINKVVFDSMTQGDQLVVRAREGSKTVKTYYSKECYQLSVPHTIYFVAEPDVPSQLFMLPDGTKDGYESL